MAIKDPLQLITPVEFKEWQGFNNILFDEVTTPENEIWFAINIASSNIDYLSGFNISKKWPEDPVTDWTDNIQTACAHYVRFLLTKDTDYLRGQSSMSQAGMTYSQSNPDDPYFIPPEVFNFLRKINEYNNTIKGYDLPNIKPRVSNFNNFITNDDNFPLNNYIPYNNVLSLDKRTKITISHPKNMLQSILNIDTSAIKDFNNTDFETKEEHNKDIETLQNTKVDKTDLNNYSTKNDLNNGLDTKQDKLIAGNNIIIDEVTNTINATGGTTDLTDYYKKEETNNLLENKQNKLIAGENIKIENNVISAIGATGGSNFELVADLSGVKTYTIPNFDVNKYGYFLNLYNLSGAVLSFNIFYVKSFDVQNYYYCHSNPRLEPIMGGGSSYYGWLITWDKVGKLTSYLMNPDCSVNEENYSFYGKIYRLKKY